MSEHFHLGMRNMLGAQVVQGSAKSWSIGYGMIGRVYEVWATNRHYVLVEWNNGRCTMEAVAHLNLAGY